MKVKKIALASFLCALMAGCGGGGGSGSSSSNGGSSSDTSGGGSSNATVNQGGTPTSPSVLKVGVQNAVSSITNSNYFSLSAAKGDKVLMHAQLNAPLSDQDNARCASNPSAYSTQFHTYDTSLKKVSGTCGEDYTFQYPSDGVFIHSFDFPYNGPGYVNASILRSGQNIALSANGDGLPVTPKSISISSSNSLVSNSFFNYYGIYLNKGQGLVLTVNLDVPLSAIQKSRCAANSSYKTQIIAMDSSLNRVGLVCGDKMEFAAPADGIYIFQFNYGSQSSGSFFANKV